MNLYEYVERLVGVRERKGDDDHPFIQWCLELDAPKNYQIHDEIPWCSAFMNRAAWHLRLPRSKSWMARSWLNVGMVIHDPHPGFDIVILKRGGPDQPGPEVLNASGHVACYAGVHVDGSKVACLGANQSDEVNFQWRPWNDILGFRRLKWATT